MSEQRQMGRDFNDRGSTLEHRWTTISLLWSRTSTDLFQRADFFNAERCQNQNAIHGQVMWQGIKRQWGYSQWRPHLTDMTKCVQFPTSGFIPFMGCGTSKPVTGPVNQLKLSIIINLIVTSTYWKCNALLYRQDTSEIKVHQMFWGVQFGLSKQGC